VPRLTFATRNDVIVTGDVAMGTAAAAVTVNDVDPLTPLRIAEIDALPGATPEAEPAGVMAATDGVAEDQVTWLVKFCVEKSE
jgi:hypothetical protein